MNKMQDVQTIQQLLDTLKNSQDWSVRKETLDILTHKIHKRAVEPLMQSLQDKDERVR